MGSKAGCKRQGINVPYEELDTLAERASDGEVDGDSISAVINADIAAANQEYRNSRIK